MKGEYIEKIKILHFAPTAMLDAEGEATVQNLSNNKKVDCFVDTIEMVKFRELEKNRINISDARFFLMPFHKKITKKEFRKKVIIKTKTKKRTMWNKKKNNENIVYHHYSINGKVIDIYKKHLIVDCGIYIYIDNRGYNFKIGDWIKTYGRMDIELVGNNQNLCK